MSKILKSLGDNVFKYVYGCRYLNGGTENMQSHMEPTRMKHANTDYMMDRGHKSLIGHICCNAYLNSLSHEQNKFMGRHLQFLAIPCNSNFFDTFRCLCNVLEG